MEKAELEAGLRKITGKQVKSIRARGLVPGVVYGRGMDSIPVEVDLKSLIKTLSSEAGLNVIISLKIKEDGKLSALPVITHDLQKDPLSGAILHVDFHKVIMEQEIKTKVPVVLAGESIGVKENGGILVHSLREAEVKCLPADIPERFELDVSALKIGDALHISDLKAVAGVAILTPLEEMVVTVAPPTKEEVVAPPPEAVPAEVPAAEGAPAPAAAAPEEPKEAKEAKETKEPKAKAREEKKS